MPRTVKIMTILVTGATGNIGRRIVDHLIDLGANDIRALTKNPAKANLPDGVTAVTGYLGDPESLSAAFEGVERMYLAPLPETLDVTLELATQATGGVCRGVVWRGALAGPHARCRRAQGRSRSTVREPYPSAVEAPISMDDIARVAAALLVKPDESHFGQMYPVTGPEALTRARIAEQIGVGIGVPIRYQQCDRAEAEAAFQTALGPERGVVSRPDRRRRRSSAGSQRPGRRAHRHPGPVGGAVGRAERRTVPLTTVLKYFASGWCSTNASVDCSG